jgi:formylmethanofuran dehydrogenase subunit E
LRRWSRPSSARARCIHTSKERTRSRCWRRELPDEELFATQWVSIPLHARAMPGYKSARVVRDACGEGINYDREVVREEGGVRQILCQGCAFTESRYYELL